MELRHKQYGVAQSVLKEATAIPPAARHAKAQGSFPVQGILHKCTKLWAFLADLQESTGNFEETKSTCAAGPIEGNTA